MYAKWNDIDIPNVRAVPISREFIGDSARTIGGKLRRDSSGLKKVWEIEAVFLTEAEALALTGAWDTTNYKEGEFWLNEFGEGNTKKAMVDPTSVQEEIVQFERDGWQENGRRLTFTVQEV